MSVSVVVKTVSSPQTCAACGGTVEQGAQVFVIYPVDPSKTTPDDAVVLEPEHAPELIDQLGSVAASPSEHRKLGDTMRAFVVPVLTAQRCPICSEFVQQGDHAVEFIETEPQLRLHAECADVLATALEDELDDNADAFLSELL